MGYSGVRGGMEAILAAERLVRRSRDHAPAEWAGTEQIVLRFRLAVDRIMGEAGLYHSPTAADAFRQAEGDVLEAAHLVRAHRSTLPRLAVTEPVDPDEMVVLRRIVPANRTPDGPQLLGRTTDYTGRLLEREGDLARDRAETRTEDDDPARNRQPERTPEQRHPRRFYQLLRDLDLVVEHGEPAEDPEPFDITRRAARPPAPRSAVLSSMARAETGALVGLWYRSILGPDGDVHEITLGDTRHGRVPLRVVHPHTGEPVQIGEIRVTEAEGIEDLDGAEEDRTRFDVGYGLCFGHNERKAIAMANLDIAWRRAEEDSPLEQLLLLTTDGLDSGGFLEHLKLPHYVTFRSMVDRKLARREARGSTGPRVPEPFGEECR
ncbi:alpha-D-ribose 1-methylphosphonate 5-triphosphate synthase subunit PhnI [Saccharopolyspora kobensis]|uniref:Alpha-D-ribose 1-methylphosphonate 5-triphosphate synthase subunit PhnI n=1 Tax=Saccharopolyspora kobensis TaxID=146035 RepID=A0A1H6CUP1_9PSEU|nr:carbon-phosphorus lyase complex subunit PhnI [Saccharopolyspora kobensis]SEG76568.1 alpha-D-ribose 1-methylphosphonate 5-triphosphate synthase subunit PhnI [Saccharopolyspora kobensis]SFC99702.1 alpha-D-ribose 1-methylphosphonate 5-triphosphate synthase subunit PhnI [Saccharopolyspora kobensis]